MHSVAALPKLWNQTADLVLAEMTKHSMASIHFSMVRIGLSSTPQQVLSWFYFVDLLDVMLEPVQHILRSSFQNGMDLLALLRQAQHQGTVGAALTTCCMTRNPILDTVMLQPCQLHTASQQPHVKHNISSHQQTSRHVLICLCLYP